MIRLLIFFLFSSLPLLSFAQNYATDLKHYRDEIAKKFYLDEFAPISNENIIHLNYFPANEQYIVEADVEILTNQRSFRMPTYDGTSNEYKKFAQLHFTLANTKHTLTVYQSASLLQHPKYEDYLFLPFLDLTNGNESYGGGRYLELNRTDIKKNKILIDFNKSYNPYCAYSSGYRCPQPPIENTLNIPILAGEKTFKGPKNERKVNKNMAQNFNEKEKSIILTGDENTKLHVYQTTDDTEIMVLKANSVDIKFDDPLVEVLKKRMLLTVQDPQHAGVGIAAPQVGINKNLIWVQRFDKANEPFEFYINPKIIWRSKLTRLGTEGCLSIPDRREEIERSYAIRLQYWDSNGDIIEENIEGFTAVIFQHEVDHLYGILYPDRLEEQAKKENVDLSDKINFSIDKKSIVRP